MHSLEYWVREQGVGGLKVLHNMGYCMDLLLYEEGLQRINN